MARHPAVKYTVIELENIADPLYSDNFQLFFPNLPLNLKLAEMSWFEKLVLAVSPFQTYTATLLGRENQRQEIARQAPKINLTDAGYNLSLRCKSVTLPGRDIEPAVVTLFGHKLRYAAMSSFSGTFNAEFYEDHTLVGTRVLGLWQDICKNHYGQIGHMKGRSGTSNPLQKSANIVKGVSKGYACDAQISLFDNSGKQISVFILRNVWPTNVAELTFDSSASPLSVSATFSFDVCEELIEE